MIYDKWKQFFNFYLIFVIHGLIFSGQIKAKISHYSPPKNQLFSINFDDINLHWQRITLMAILKTKAKAIISENNFPILEKLMFSRCASDAKTPVKLAKCVVELFTARDRFKIQNSNQLYSNKYSTEFIQNDIFPVQFMKKFQQLFLPKKSNIQKKLKQIKIPIQKYYLEKKMKRKKREIFSKTKKQYKNLEKLKKLQEYIHLNQKCTKYMEKLNEQNQNFIQAENLPIDMKMEKSFDPKLEQVMKVLEQVTDEKFSVLSPQILPVLPTKRHPNLLSPTILSFNKDGFFSLPDIFHSFNPGKEEQYAWMDLLMYITGAGKKLDNVLTELKPQIEQMKNKIYPAVLKMEELERKIRILKQTLSENQQKQFEKNGYAFLELDQMEFIHGKNHNYGNVNLADYEHEEKLEDYIKMLSKIDEKNITNVSRRSKRQELVSNYIWDKWHVLKPWAFVNRLNETVIFEAIILSPHAFHNEYLTFEFNVHDILAPRAFKVATLSPAIFMSRILSPLAFGAEILSPRILAALILSPMTLYTEIISPQILEVHVGSPDALHVQILSPNILGPRAFSPDSFGVLVLSPNILSPRWISQEHSLVEILSPHVLGGEETEEEEESNIHHESDLPESHRFHKHSRGGVHPPGSTWLLDPEAHAGAHAGEEHHHNFFGAELPHGDGIQIEE